MGNTAKRLYEGLFLVDSAEAVADAQGIQEHIEKIFERNDAEIVSIRKWDERPLAYEIMGKNRGTYFLIYFNSLSDKITSIERDAQLSERIMRILILRADHVTKEDMEKETPAAMAVRQEQERTDAKKIPVVDDYTADNEDDVDIEQPSGEPEGLV